MHFRNEFLFLPRTWSQILDIHSPHWLPRRQHKVWNYPGGPINCGMPKQHKIHVSALMCGHTLRGLKQHTSIICGSESDMGQMELKWKCWQSGIPSWRFWGRFHFFLPMVFPTSRSLHSWLMAPFLPLQSQQCHPYLRLCPVTSPSEPRVEMFSLLRTHLIRLDTPG